MSSILPLPHLIKTILVTCICAFISIGLTGCDDSPNGLVVSNATIGDAPPSAPSRAAYFAITNHTETEQRLVGVTSAQFQKAEIHKTILEKGMMHMDMLSEVIIAPNQTVTFEPGGLHIMLIQPLDPAALDHLVTLELLFLSSDKQPTTLTTSITLANNTLK